MECQKEQDVPAQAFIQKNCWIKMWWLCEMSVKKKEGRNRLSLHDTAVHQRHFTRRQSLCHLLGQRRGKKVQSVKGTGRRKPQKRTLEYLFKARADKTPNHNDGYGMIPECPICGEMPYSTKQCHWCGQRFIQDKEVEEYEKPLTKEVTCFHAVER